MFEQIRTRIQYYFDLTCLARFPLLQMVIAFLIIDAVTSIASLLVSSVYHFIYVIHGGRSGFIDDDFAVEHVDIFKYRRHQPWELEVPIDWEFEDRMQINETRNMIDEKCSTYPHNISIPGDPGDYLKEVVGRPNSSGYNTRLQIMMKLWLACSLMNYFSLPLIVLILWWKTQRPRLVSLFVFIRIFPLIIFIALNILANSGLMCALDIIMGFSVTHILLLATICLWVFTLGEIIVVCLYSIEQSLSKKRKDYGFRKKRQQSEKDKKETKPLEAATTESDADQLQATGQGQKQVYTDFEEKVRAERHSIKHDTKIAKPTQSEMMTAKKIAREILELGNTTEDESTYEAKMADKMERRQRKSSGGDSGKGKERRSNKDSLPLKKKSSLKPTDLSGSQRRSHMKVTFEKEDGEANPDKKNNEKVQDQNDDDNTDEYKMLSNF